MLNLIVLNWNRCFKSLPWYFNIVCVLFQAANTETPEDLERKRRRLERFGSSVSDEEKKKSERAIRFGLSEAKKVQKKTEEIC